MLDDIFSKVIFTVSFYFPVLSDSGSLESLFQLILDIVGLVEIVKTNVDPVSLHQVDLIISGAYQAGHTFVCDNKFAADRDNSQIVKAGHKNGQTLFLKAAGSREGVN